MQLQDISARLFQSISVGICLVEADTGVIIFQNETFGTWFTTAVVGQVWGRDMPVTFSDSVSYTHLTLPTILLV